MRVLAVVVALAIMVPVEGAQKQTVERHFAAAEPMPPDRADDSYAIYSLLLTSGPIEWRDARRKQWLLEATTQAEPLGSECHPMGGYTSMDPHYAVQPPAERKSELHELLEDFDRHCHDVLQLEAGRFHLALPVRLLDRAMQETYRREQPDWRPDGHAPPELTNGAGLHRFTQVYFNAHHTMAMVQQGMFCGGLCGNWTWVVLERRDGAWHVLPWQTTSVIS